MKRKELKMVGSSKEVAQPTQAAGNTCSENVPRIKLSFDGEPQFFVNEKKRTVACKINTFVNLPEELNQIASLVYTGRGCKERKYYFTTVGVAKLHEGEEWNETVGCRLAECRAKKMAYATARGYTHQVLKDAIYCMRSVCNFESEMNGLLKREDEHIDELINSIES